MMLPVLFLLMVVHVSGDMFSKADKNIIVDRHNEVRRLHVDQKGATDMRLMVSVSQGWAD